MTELLDNEVVLCHPYVIGEIACGYLRNRDAILSELRKLDSAIRVSHDEALSLIERAQVYGKGIGYIDLHLLASALVMGVPLWTRDKALQSVAQSLETAY